MDLLAEGARELGIELSSEQLEQFRTFYRELADWNLRANLTSITGREEVQTKHFLDSLTVCLAVRKGLAVPARIIDVGSGAGFPGLPLKIAFPQLAMELVDSVGKKTAFLEHVVGVLGLEDVVVHTGRAEALGREPALRDSFDLALIRGVARLPLLLEYALPFCRVGGSVVALKHGGLDAELQGAARALGELGGEVTGVFPVELKGLQDHRVVAAIRKVAATPDRYPRRTGIPAKRPL